MKAAATLNINNGNPQENKLQREQVKEKKVQFYVKFIACPASPGDMDTKNPFSIFETSENKYFSFKIRNDLLFS